MNEILTFLDLATIIGFMGVLFALIANLQKNDKLYLNIAIVSFAFWVGHFYLLEQFNTAFLFVLIILRIGFAQIFFKNKPVTFLFLAITIAQGFYFVNTPLDMLPIIVGIISTIANFMYRGVELRVLIMCASILLIINAIVVGSVPALIFELMNLVVLAKTVRSFLKKDVQKMDFTLSFAK